jgi:hypothetical protein
MHTLRALYTNCGIPFTSMEPLILSLKWYRSALPGKIIIKIIYFMLCLKYAGTAQNA